MKNSSKKSLEKRGIISAGRALSAPSAQAHDDKRRANRKTDKQRFRRELQLETARTRGPFPFWGPLFWRRGKTNPSCFLWRRMNSQPERLSACADTKRFLAR